MESAAEEICLQKLEELVFDEDKIVTISITCQKLDVSVLEAKVLLKKFVSDQKISPGKISVTYLISGKLKTGDYSIEIINGKDLKEKKRQFESITDEVVYSVQKNNVIDFNLIALSEKSDDGYFRPAPLKGSIVSEKCLKRDIKTKELPPLPPPKNFEKQKPSSFFKASPKDQTNGDKEKTAKETVKEVKAQPQKKAGGLANFLSQSSTKENTQKVKNEKSDEDERESKRARIESNDSVEVKDEKVEKIKDEEKGETKDEEKRKTKDEEKKKTKDEAKKVTKNKKTKKDSDKDGKKRKRIVVESDSDDDIFGNTEEEKMEVIESDEEPPVDVKPKQPPAPVPKNKRRKAVEKTYEDEEGYVVTRTEYVLVSASEDEEENVEPPKKENKVSHKTEPKEEKKISPVKGAKKKGKAVAANQPTLMNFFKKK